MPTFEPPDDDAPLGLHEGLAGLTDAILLATEAHDGQVDKTGKPYILHPLRVMLHMETEEEQMVAVLHDVLEDTPVTDVDLFDAGFSRAVVNAVRAVSREKGKETYRDFIERVAENPLAVKVKLADLSDNLTRLAREGLPDSKEAEGLMTRYRRAWHRLSFGEWPKQ